MPLPNNFSPTEHLQDLIKRTVNQEVKEWFRDVTEDDLSTPRGSLRVGCTHVEADTMNMTIGRLMLFYNVVGASPHSSKAFIMPDRQVFQLEGNPQVILLFSETAQSWKSRKAERRETMRCSFRVMNEDFSNATDKTKIDSLERKIRLAFPPNFRHQVGQTSYVYVDKSRGFQLRVYAYSESDSKTMIRKLLNCALIETPFEETRFSRASTKNAGKKPKKRVLGKDLKQREVRPTAVMALRQADLFIPGWGSQTLIYRNLV